MHTALWSCRIASMVSALALIASCRPDRQAITDPFRFTPSTATITSTTVTLYPTADTRLNLDAVNYSQDTLLTLYTWPDGKIANAILMKFDLSSIPAGATVSSATLSLYQIDADATADPTYTATVHAIINHNPTLAQATGYTYDGVNGWTPNVCCSGSAPMAQADIGAPVDSPPLDKTVGPKAWTVTSLVQGWLDNPPTNFGLLVNSDPSKLADHWRYFSSSEHTPSQRPSLIVTYTVGVPDPGAWPNEPPGFTVIKETGWEDGTLDGWDLVNMDTGCYEKDITVTDIPDSIPASPILESKMLQIFYPKDHCGGGGTEARYDFSAPRDQVFVGYYVQVNGTWQGHWDSAVNKMIYVYNGNPSFSAMWYEMFGTGSDPLGLYVVSDVPGGETGYGPVTEEVFPRGQWHRVEIYQKQETPALQDGVVRVWVDGVLALERTDVITGTAPVNSLTISGIWGGVGDVKQHSDYMRFDHIRISGQ